MSGLKEIKNRINSVGSTIQITSAMKMVSAAKLKKAQDAIVTMRPFAKHMELILRNVCANLDSEVGGKFVEKKSPQKVLLVAITSNRGLCGAFNASVIKEVVRLSKTTYVNQEIEILTIGKKANDLLAKTYSIRNNHSAVFDNLIFKNVSGIAEEIIDDFLAGAYDKVELVYNQFKNAATTILTREQLLPVTLPTTTASENITVDYLYEPSKEEIVRTLIPQTIKTQLFKALLDSVAAEHGSRMTAMHKATDNAETLKNELLLTYNKARQAAITNEILEIVGGAEALNG